MQTILLLENVVNPENLTKDMFKQLCPVLIYQLDTDACHQHHGQGHLNIPVNRDQDHPEAEGHEHDHDDATNLGGGFGSVPGKGIH